MNGFYPRTSSSLALLDQITSGDYAIGNGGGQANGDGGSQANGDGGGQANGIFEKDGCLPMVIWCYGEDVAANFCRWLENASESEPTQPLSKWKSKAEEELDEAETETIGS